MPDIPSPMTPPLNSAKPSAPDASISKAGAPLGDAADFAVARSPLRFGSQQKNVRQASGSVQKQMCCHCVTIRIKISDDTKQSTNNESINPWDQETSTPVRIGRLAPPREEKRPMK